MHKLNEKLIITLNRLQNFFFVKLTSLLKLKTFLHVDNNP